MTSTVYTIGHSTHASERFLGLLTGAGVTAIADVRSAPYSRHTPQFNRDTLSQSLAACAIQYVFLGRELGARSGDPSCYENGRVQYGRLAATELFRAGLDRVVQGSHRFRVALMCAEKEPIECHRTVLVAQALAQRGVPIEHILADGSIEQHDATMDRLLDVVGLPRRHLFRSREDLVAEGLILQESRIAYVDEKLAAEAGGDVP